MYSQLDAVSNHPVQLGGLSFAAKMGGVYPTTQPLGVFKQQITYRVIPRRCQNVLNGSKCRYNSKHFVVMSWDVHNSTHYTCMCIYIYIDVLMRQG